MTGTGTLAAVGTVSTGSSAITALYLEQSPTSLDTEEAIEIT